MATKYLNIQKLKIRLNTINIGEKNIYIYRERERQQLMKIFSKYSFSLNKILSIVTTLNLQHHTLI